MSPRTLVVPPEAGGQRLDRFLVSEMADLSRSQIQRLILDGHVTMTRAGGWTAPPAIVTARANMTVHELDSIRIDAPEPSTPRSMPKTSM